MALGKLRQDEEALAEGLSPDERRSRGAFFTPAPLVDAVLEAVAPFVPHGHARGHGRRVSVVDPAAGGGAFLVGAARRFPQAQLFGLELDEASLATCAARLPQAQLQLGDGLREGWPKLCASLPDDGFELWVGNPPYNGTSQVLADPAAYRALRALLAKALPAGTSLRDDYAFFLLRAAERLGTGPTHREGALAFVTSATLLDAFLYAPLREALLGRLRLREVMELGGGAFRGTRVRTCVTVWTSGGSTSSVKYRARARVPASVPFAPSQLSGASTFTPAAPEFFLRPVPAEAQALDERWRRDGEPLTTLLPVHSPGLKTRFDELLTADDPGALLARLEAFFATPASSLPAFARAFGIPSKHLPKLEALKAREDLPPHAERSRVQPFWRYAGARHRGALPPSARAYCYLDRRLIPRGDHRFRGDWDPHAGPLKLIFNTRELPLSAALLEVEGCVHDHRHARFAPLWVPIRLRDEGLGAAKPGAQLGPLVPNLSARGLAWARTLGGPEEAFRALVRFINSPQVQEVWAPALGACRDLPVPLLDTPRD